MTGSAAGGWGLSRYRQLRVRVDDAYVDRNTNSVVIGRGDEFFDVAIDGVDPARVVSRVLDLRRRSPSPGDDPWVVEMLEMLDELGLLDDASDGTAVSVAEQQDLAVAVGDGVAWLDSRLPLAARVLACDVVGVAEDLRSVGLPYAPGGAAPTNVPLTLLALQLRYWRGGAQLAEAAVRWLLADVSGGSDASLWQDRVALLSGGEHDSGYAVDAVHSACALLMLASRDDAALWASVATRPEPERMSGISHVLRTEEAVRDAVASMSERTYQSVLEQGDHPRSFTEATFVEQYYVTSRFVDAITPAMAARLRPALRERIFRYFAEEVGHEVMERATCVALGVPDERIENYLPMPYFLGFIEAFVVVAGIDPLTFLTSVMVTEGLPGDPFGINDLLGDPSSYGPEFESVFRHHEGINDSVSHALLARALLSEVPSVSRERHRAAVDATVFLTEVAERAWQLLMDFHTDGSWASCLPPAYQQRSSMATAARRR